MYVVQCVLHIVGYLTEEMIVVRLNYHIIIISSYWKWTIYQTLYKYHKIARTMLGMFVRLQVTRRDMRHTAAI